MPLIIEHQGNIVIMEANGSKRMGSLLESKLKVMPVQTLISFNG